METAAEDIVTGFLADGSVGYRNDAEEGVLLVTLTGQTYRVTSRHPRADAVSEELHRRIAAGERSR